MTTLLTSGVYVRTSAPLPVQAQASCSSDASTNVQASAMGMAKQPCAHCAGLQGEAALRVKSRRSSTAREVKAKQH